VNLELDAHVCIEESPLLFTTPRSGLQLSRSRQLLPLIQAFPCFPPVVRVGGASSGILFSDLIYRCNELAIEYRNPVVAFKYGFENPGQRKRNIGNKRAQEKVDRVDNFPPPCCVISISYLATQINLASDFNPTQYHLIITILTSVH